MKNRFYPNVTKNRLNRSKSPSISLFTLGTGATTTRETTKQCDIILRVNFNMVCISLRFVKTWSSLALMTRAQN